ncbi:hypothetical protein POM88_048242 [Heracleum sosnowskyi]|uniref:Uncharacterized protein n=1 Tax=Heracleum sosnowskyi TaxID=360622 RepID=A0AAD8GVU4_9APIA|nr:hypothetical protein POM88_048242 [Heracleum sosnowskyi]
MALRITPPAIHAAAQLTTINNKKTIIAAVKLVARKRTDLSLSCEYRNKFTRPVISSPHRSLLEIVAAYSHDGEVVKDKNLDEKDDQNSLDISVLQNSREIMQRLQLQNYIDEFELREHLASLGDTGATIHGLWKSHVINGKVVSDLDDDKYAKDKSRASELAKTVLEIPSMSAKLKKMWMPPNHTNKIEDFIAHEMAKHGFLSLWYFVIALEAASPFFDENGNFMLLKIMKELGYEQGKFNCLQLQSDLTKRLGYQILMTYGDKKEQGKLYPREVGVLFGGNIKRMNYLLPKLGVGQDLLHEFFLDGIDATSHIDQSFES